MVARSCFKGRRGKEGGGLGGGVGLGKGSVERSPVRGKIVDFSYSGKGLQGGP